MVHFLIFRQNLAVYNWAGGHEVGGAFLIIRIQNFENLWLACKLHVRAHLLYYAYGASVEEWF